MNLFENLQKMYESFGNYNEFAIDFRSMHTAIHGLIVFNNKRDALNAYDTLKKLEHCDNDTDYELILQSVLDSSEYLINEINYKDISKDLVYDNIKVINALSIDLYI